MLEFENEAYRLGYNKIACIDEVGRGCLAGDVVACAIIMPKDIQIDGIKDSKKLSQKKRELFYDLILEDCLAFGLGRVDSKTIDKINIKKSTRLAMKKAVENLRDKDGNIVCPDYLLIDAEEIDLDIPYNSIIKGDDKSYGIACSSIVAKVYRDNLCVQWDKDYPGYNLKKHKGYGTKEHRNYIKAIGPSEIHRLSFLKKILNN